MRSTWKYIVAAIIFGYFAACAPVKFQKVNSDGTGVKVAGDVCPYACDASGNSCVQRCEVERTVGVGMVDILIIDDNSGSMSPEQAKMATRFPDFLNSITHLDYRIAITTT